MEYYCTYCNSVTDLPECPTCKREAVPVLPIQPGETTYLSSSAKILQDTLMMNSIIKEINGTEPTALRTIKRKALLTWVGPSFLPFLAILALAIYSWSYAFIIFLAAFLIWPVIIIRTETDIKNLLLRLSKKRPTDSPKDIIRGLSEGKIKTCNLLSTKLIPLFMALFLIGSIKMCVSFTREYDKDMDSTTIYSVKEDADVQKMETEDSMPEETVFTPNESGYLLEAFGTNHMAESEIVIPDTYEEKPVTAIGKKAFYGFEMQSVQIPETVTEIQNSAFANCENLNRVEIPDSVERIGGGTFMNCISLREIVFGKNVSEIGGEVFKNCISLTTVRIPSLVTEIRGNCFEKCTSLEKVELHENITAIHGYAFYGCSSLSEITLPPKITEIRGSTFELCTSLKSVVIPDGVVRVAAHAFYGCRSLKSVTFPDSIQEIGSSAFRNCPDLYSVSLPKGTAVNERAFKDSPTKIIYRGRKKL